MAEVKHLTESRRQMMTLAPGQVAALKAVGKRLAGSKAYWGDTESASADDEVDNDRSVISCVHLRDDEFEVTVNEAVGVIALPDLQLVVQSKVPINHLEYLMRHSRLAPRIGDTNIGAEASDLLWELVVHWYVASLERLIREGLLSDYEAEVDRLPTVRGSIRVHDTALDYYRGQPVITCEFDEFGPDTPLNRVLRAAALAVAHSPLLDGDLRARCRRALARMDGVGAARRSDLRSVLDRRTARYEQPIALARHVLAGTGRTVESGSHHGHTFLIRTPELVEDAVRRILHDGLADITSVRKKGIKLDGSTLTLNPDLVFGDIATGDVKYKLQGKDWKRPDLYQAITFATGYRCQHACVITFAAAEMTAAPSLVVGDVRLRLLTWDCSEVSTPLSSAAALVKQARNWLQSCS